MLRLAVFDLDFTVWKPEMYEINGPPKLRKNKQKEDIVTDQSNTQISIFEGASYALAHINRLRENENMDIQAAVASRTDEPLWAETCMNWLLIKDGKSLTACFDHVEIGFDDKKWHFQRLKQKTGIDYEHMVFFDNEMRNIRSVRELNVKCVYTPDGMTKEAWHEALEQFNMDLPTLE
mmetsp:Transcript_19655/g.24238  ORF Transcript_19655/g.24238 Transcript_19655/m.24238 type:complete len:178 (-) Transcript_19655:111-644(-)